ncbi:MAG: ABC transporter substrate-binding protein [Solirubrobacteraceae bacterium]|jgi:putative hydroxymethylpyrimidine transport system substrate-binding protein
MLTRPLRGRRAPLAAAALISLAGCAGCGEVHARTAPGPQRNVVLALAGQPSALYAPLYEAQANGDFALGALSVTVTNPPAGETPLQALAAGHASFAIASEPELLAARAGGAQLVAIASLTQGPLESIISLGGSRITSPTQLAGATVASSGTPLADAELTSVLRAAGVAPSRVHTITVTGSLNAALLSHAATATLGGFLDYDAVSLALARQHPNVISLSGAGVPSFSDLVIVVRVSEAHYDGALLRAFLQSLMRGEIATLDDPQAVVKLLVRRNPRLSRSFESAALAAGAPLASPRSQNEPFGYQNPAAWQTFGNWMDAHGLLSHATNGALAITDEFLPGQGE